MDVSGFYGLWDVYSGPAHFELLLNNDGSYGQAMWGGAQQVWGRWTLQPGRDQPLLALEVQGANPQWLLQNAGPGPLVEYHPVIGVQPNQIQMSDALMVRRYVPATPQVFPTPVAMPAQMPAARHGVSASDFIAAIRSAPVPVATPMAQAPIAAPVATYSAPPPAAAPPEQSTPVTAQMLQANAAVAQQIQQIQLQMYKDTRQTNIDIEAANAAEDTAEFTARAKAIQDQQQASHAMAERFTNQVIKGGRIF